MKIEKKKWWCAIALIIVTGIAIVLRPPVFYLNDDVTMRSILSGAYTGTPDGHAVYMQYPLTGFLAILYRVAGGVPWLEVFFTLCIVACMILLASRFEQPVIGCLFAVVLFVPFCLYMHYTLVAALLAGTAVFLLATGQKRICPLVLFLLAYMIRSQVGYLSLPFVACAMVWQVVIAPEKAWKQQIIDWIKYSGVLLGSMAVCLLINSACYSSPEWKEYLAYNDSRTLLYDYTDFLSTDKYREEYAAYGMTAEEYAILTSYDTMLDGSLDAVKMQEVAQAVSLGMEQDTSFLQQVKDCVLKYYNQIRYSDAPYNYIWMIAYVLLAVGFLICRKWLPLLILTILGVGRSSIWMYLIWKGRFPERVSLSLYIMELMILLGMGIWLVRRDLFKRTEVGAIGESTETENTIVNDTMKADVTEVAETVRDSGLLTKRVKGCAIAVLLVILVFFACYQWKATTAKVQYQAGVQREWNMLKNYCEEDRDRLYLVDVFSVVEYAGMQYEKDAENMMLLGGWMSAGPLANKRFAELGFSDGAECLYYCENVSLIAELGADMSWLEEYLQNRFGECKLEIVAEINSRDPKGFVEYQVIKVN